MARPVRLLLDVNVWVALFDEQHVHNGRAVELVSGSKLRIASCPIVENGALRVANIPAFNRPSVAGFQVIREKMQAVCRDVDHEFWPDDISLRTDKVIDWGRVSGHSQITDAYLLALAVKHKGALASFDQRIAISAVVGATPNHLVLL